MSQADDGSIYVLLCFLGKPLRTNVTSSLHPLAQSTGYVPSQKQLKERLLDLAKLNGMTEGVAEGMDDLVGAALDVSLRCPCDHLVWC